MPSKKVPSGAPLQKKAPGAPAADRPWPPAARCQRLRGYWKTQTPPERAAKTALLDTALCQRLHQRHLRLLHDAAGNKRALTRASELSRKYGVHEMHARKRSDHTVELFWGRDVFSNEAIAALLEGCPKSLEEWCRVQHVGKCEAEQPIMVELMFAAEDLRGDGYQEQEWAYVGRAFYCGLVQQLCAQSWDAGSRTDPAPAPEARLPAKTRRRVAQALAAKRTQDLALRALLAWKEALEPALAPLPRYVLVIKNTFVDTFWEDKPSVRCLEEEGDAGCTKRPRPARAVSADSSLGSRLPSE